MGLLLYRYIVLEHTPSKIRTLWILDTSLSMTVEDISSEENHMMISRHDLARKMILEGIDMIPGEHALITYARDASVETPFSGEKDHIKNIISHTSPVEFYGGSNLMSALSLANSLYGGSNMSIHIILLSDGGMENTTPSVALSQIFTLSFIWIGTSRGGKIPLWYNAEGNRRYKYFSGQEIVVEYDDLALGSLSNLYDATLVRRETTSPFPSEVLPLEVTDMKKLIFLALGTFCVIFWYFLHPYAHKK